jgi:hypothetical protein
MARVWLMQAGIGVDGGLGNPQNTEMFGIEIEIQ